MYNLKTFASVKPNLLRQMDKNVLRWRGLLCQLITNSVSVSEGWDKKLYCST